ncbi:hypothetical protein MHH54_02745 [Bacillus sp. FSL K6-4563]|uniref:hypothetical protein n=1 Tax=Bacillus TaxID=1386 RepID=UPI000D044DAF|nr:hypothetical protein [Bacillus pumilus]PRS11410.1 hypothetical protein C6X95_16795 [Bacillus pumilus]PRS59939.1 hypothetical protein C6X97_16335 [Bacillus pumilus]
MIKRFSLVLFTLMMSIVVLLVAAKNSPGDHVISFDQPHILIISIVIMVCLFTPPLVMSFFSHLIVRTISSLYQCFIVLSFLGLIPIGFLIPDFLTIVVSIVGTLASVASLIVTLRIDRNKDANLN